LLNRGADLLLRKLSSLHFSDIFLKMGR